MGLQKAKLELINNRHRMEDEVKPIEQNKAHDRMALLLNSASEPTWGASRPCASTPSNIQTESIKRTEGSFLTLPNS